MNKIVPWHVMLLTVVLFAAAAAFAAGEGDYGKMTLNICLAVNNSIITVMFRDNQKRRDEAAKSRSLGEDGR